MTDLSNAWGGHPEDNPEQWVEKEAIPYPVLLESPEGRRHYLLWRFPKVGSTIRPHTHPQGHCHDTIVVTGSFKVTGERDRGDCIVTAPDVLYFDSGREHSFLALTDEARLLHVFERSALADPTTDGM